MVRVQAATLLLCLWSLASLAKAETCSVTTTETLRCERGHGRKPIPSTLSGRLDLQKGIYYRCADANNCLDLPVRFTTSGSYLIIESPGWGLVGKLTLDSFLPPFATAGDFNEMTTFGGSAYVGF